MFTFVAGPPASWVHDTEAFAGVGLGLGLVGVYGVVAQLARRRTRELGIRVALGARGAQLQWLVVRHGVGLSNKIGGGAGYAGDRVAVEGVEKRRQRRSVLLDAR